MDTITEFSRLLPSLEILVRLPAGTHWQRARGRGVELLGGAALLDEVAAGASGFREVGVVGRLGGHGHVGLVAGGEVLVGDLRHGGVGVAVLVGVGVVGAALDVAGRCLEGAVELVRVLLEALGREGHEAARGDGFHGGTADDVLLVLQVGRHVGLELLLQLLLLRLVLQQVLHRLLPLRLVAPLHLLALVALGLALVLPVEEVELALALLLLAEFGVVDLELLEFLDGEVLELLEAVLGVLRGVQTVPALEVGVLEYLGDLQSVLGVDAEYLLDEVDFDGVWVGRELPKRVEKMRGFFISAMTSSPVSPRKGA